MIKKLILYLCAGVVLWRVFLESGPFTSGAFLWVFVMIELIGLYVRDNNVQWSDLISRLGAKGDGRGKKVGEE